MQGGAGKRVKKHHLADFIGTKLAPDWWQKQPPALQTLVPGSPKTKAVFRLRSYNDNA